MTILEVIGIYGTIMILGSYGLNTFGYVTAHNKWYQLMNLTGGVAFVYYTLEKAAWASLFVNTVWVLIALIGLWQMHSRSLTSVNNIPKGLS